MIVKILPFFVVLGSVLANFEGVDPNTLKCDPAGLTSLHLPHFTDCDKFYMCAHGMEIEFSCAPGTIFDFPLQVCNWPFATKCYLRTRKDDDVEGSGEEDISPSAGDIIKPIAAEALMSANLNCKNMDNAARRVGYKGDCQRYWSCAAGTPRASYCTDGLFFNEQTQQCDFEANVKCTEENIDELDTEFIEYK